MDTKQPATVAVGSDGSGSAPIFTREKWLAVRVVDGLLKSGVDIEHSPARLVWDAARAEIEVWMQRHGMALGLPTMQRDQPLDTEELANRIACHFVGNCDISLDEGRQWCREILSQNIQFRDGEDVRPPSP